MDEERIFLVDNYDLATLRAAIIAAVAAVRVVQPIPSGVAVHCNNPGDAPDSNGSWPPSRIPTADERTAIQAVIDAHDPLPEIRTAAIVTLNEQAAAAEGAIDSLIAGHHVRALMLNTEIVAYFEAGRPADPAANVYVIANAMATRRGITLRDMLEILFSRWRDVQADIGDIVTELDRVTEAIEAATDEAGVQAALDGAVWP